MRRTLSFEFILKTHKYKQTIMNYEDIILSAVKGNSSKYKDDNSDYNLQCYNIRTVSFTSNTSP